MRESETRTVQLPVGTHRSNSARHMIQYILINTIEQTGQKINFLYTLYHRVGDH